ncbi:hypothetical protein Tco_0842681 [Tanacetum coccineum]|uniref:Uncharacterized protein n=1 Tax=Tanacetum coccineum TaxID=301880 RepID=A0ABQ5B4A4_9ASTR
MDWYTKNSLWVYWMRGNNEVVLSNKEVSDLKDKNNNDEHKIAEIFRIETNLFDYKTLLCTRFNVFNYLFKVDTELFTHDIERTKTYEDYENELNKEVGEPWSKNGVPNGRAGNDSDIQEKEEQHKEGQCDLLDDPAQKPSVCKIRRFEMIKYSFGQEEEYIVVKEYGYDDLTRTNKDACDVSLCGVYL